VAKESIQIIFW